MKNELPLLACALPSVLSVSVFIDANCGELKRPNTPR